MSGWREDCQWGEGRLEGSEDRHVGEGESGIAWTESLSAVDTRSKTSVSFRRNIRVKTDKELEEEEGVAEEKDVEWTKEEDSRRKTIARGTGIEGGDGKEIEEKEFEGEEKEE